METFLISTGTVALAEMGDRTQLIAMMLTARYGRPLPILAGIFVATLANHLVAGFAGVMFGRALSPHVLDFVVGIGMLAMALWMLKPDRVEGEPTKASDASVFLATATAFFVAEFGDKTQIATLTLAAAYANVLLVVAGTTLGMMLANAPVVVFGGAFVNRIPLRMLNLCAAALLGVLGSVFVYRALTSH